MSGETQVLLVCRWPVGGIRTFIKYVYGALSRSTFRVTMLASFDPREADQINPRGLERDMDAIGVQLEWVYPTQGRSVMAMPIAAKLASGRYDVIHSQGFISAAQASLANYMHRVPHVMTVHGVLEARGLSGRLGQVRRWALERLLGCVDRVHCVSRDSARSLAGQMPSLRRRGIGWHVIPNGIDPRPFAEASSRVAAEFRAACCPDGSSAVLGWFGRFMPEKGFECVIEAIEAIERAAPGLRDVVVCAVGSGDYLDAYRRDIEARGLGHRFHFLPYTDHVADYMLGCDAVLMPSLWEAWPLLSCEVLCVGVPLIASTCIGLREAIRDTPALTIPPGDARRLEQAIRQVVSCDEYRTRAMNFRTTAQRRFDVTRTAGRIGALLAETGGKVSRRRDYRAKRRP